MLHSGRTTIVACRFWISVLSLLLTAEIAPAQVEDDLDYNFLGAGARANGMGDAFIAVADDATAIFWNPAGLFTLDQPEASFGFQFASERVEQERQGQMLLLATDEPIGSVNLNFASFVFPKRIGKSKMVFAFAVQKAFDFKSELQEINDLDPFTLRQSRNSGGPFSYSAGFALSPVRGLMLGLSLSFYRGDAGIMENHILNRGDGLVLTNSFNNRLPVEGTSVGLGALYDFQSSGGPPIRLGFKFVPAFDFSGRIDADLTFRIADSQGILAEENLVTNYDYVLDFPLDLGIGMAWSPRRDLLIAADYEHRRFRDSALRLFGVPNILFDENGNLTIQRVDLINTLSDSGDDLNQWRVGFEWSWVNKLTVVPIRAGVKNLPQVSAHERRFVDLDDGQVSTFFDDQVVGRAFTLGVGFVTDSFVFDLSTEFGGWTQKVIEFGRDGMDFQEFETRRLSLKMSLVAYF